MRRSSGPRNPWFRLNVDRVQPERGGPVVPIHVDVRGLARLVTVEVESIGTVTQDGRHGRP